MGSDPLEYRPDAKDKALIAEIEEAADPTVSSKLAPETLKRVGATSRPYRYGIYEDESGNRYVRLKGKDSGPSQQVITRLLKGVMNVSDVISFTKNGSQEYYSRIMPLEKIQGSTQDAEIDADCLLAWGLFSDDDHGPRGHAFSNMARRGDALAHYDFGKAYGELYGSVDYGELIADAEPPVLQMLSKKLEMLSRSLEGSEGIGFFNDVLTATGKKAEELFEPYPARVHGKLYMNEMPEDVTSDSLYQLFVDRLQSFKTAVKGKLQAES